MFSKLNEYLPTLPGGTIELSLRIKLKCKIKKNFIIGFMSQLKLNNYGKPGDMLECYYEFTLLGKRNESQRFNDTTVILNRCP